MRIISVINLKGGVGKTFTAVQMSYLLNQKYAARVLLLDNDKQGNLSKAYSTYRRAGLCHTARLLMGLETAEMVRQRTEWDGIDIISANMSLLSATVQLQGEGALDQCSRYRSLQGASDEAGNLYDYVIIDNPPDIGLNVINALAVTDDVIVPIKIDQWALEGMDIITEQIEEIRSINPKINFTGALVTMYRNNDTNVSGVDWLKLDKVRLFNTCIRYSERAAESTFFQQPVQLYSPRSAVARSYRQLVEEYLQMIGEEK